MLVFTHHVRLWHIYAMNILVAIGFWMFFPTVNALIQELTPDDKMLDSNSLLLAALQGGWLMAGAVVGFMYNHVGLGGVLLIDCASYAVSLACILQVRKGTSDGLASAWRSMQRRHPPAQSRAIFTNSGKAIATSGRTVGCC